MGPGALVWVAGLWHKWTLVDIAYEGLVNFDWVKGGKIHLLSLAVCTNKTVYKGSKSRFP